jgi:group I intron endonuclease
VYVIRHHPSGQVYVGCSDDIEVRWRGHLQQLSSGHHPSRPLQRAWDADGRTAFSFDILELTPPDVDLRGREEAWMRVYSGKLLNSMPDNRHGEESRANMSDSAIRAWQQRHDEGTDFVPIETRREVARMTQLWARQLTVRAHKRLIALRQNAAANFRTPEALANNAAKLRGRPKSAAHRAAMKLTHSSGTCRCHPRKETT